MTEPMSVDRILAEELEELQFHNMQIIAKAAILEEARLMEEDVSAHPDPASEKDLQKFMKQANRVLRRQRLVRDCKKAYAAFAKVAVILLIIVVGGVCTVINVEAVRVPVLNWLIDVQEKYTQIQFLPTANNEIPDIEFGYLPNGFTIQFDREGINSKMYSLISDDVTIYVDIFSTNSPINLDTEDAIVTNITIQDEYSAMLIEKDSHIQLFWSDNSYVYIINAEYSVDEIIKIANSIEIKK